MKRQWRLVGFALCAVLMAGCAKTGNLFSFTHKSSDAASETNLTVLVADATAAIEAGDFAAAEALYQRAVDTNPTSSEARIGLVNAVTKQIQSQGLDLLTLTKGFTNQQAGASAPFLYNMIAAPAAARAHGYYLFPKDPTAKYGIQLAKIIKLYQTYIAQLGPICNGETDLTIAKVPSVYFANLSFAYLLRGVIRIIDKEEDGTVSYVVFRNNTTNQYEVYNTADVNDATDPNVNLKLTSASGIITSTEEANGIADLNSAITHIGNAKTYSKDNTATLWAQIEQLLIDARTMIDGLRS